MNKLQPSGPLIEQPKKNFHHPDLQQCQHWWRGCRNASCTKLVLIIIIIYVTIITIIHTFSKKQWRRRSNASGTKLPCSSKPSTSKCRELWVIWLFDDLSMIIEIMMIIIMIIIRQLGMIIMMILMIMPVIMITIQIMTTIDENLGWECKLRERGKELLKWSKYISGHNI